MMRSLVAARFYWRGKERGEE